jgi:hypothetical protein
MVKRIENAKRKQMKIRKIIEQNIEPNIEKILEFKNYSLEYRLKFLLSNLDKAIEKDNKIKNLIKAMNNYGFDKTDIDKTDIEKDIETEFRKKGVDYTSGDIENIESIVKYTLLCLLEHNDNARYQLLYKYNKSYVSNLNFNTNVNGIEENMKLISLAEGYYTFFKTKVNDLLIFYLYYNEQSVSKPIIPEIRSYICDIYNGIVLLTVSSNNTELIVYDKKPFTSRVLLNDKPFTSSKVLTNNKEIVEFFKNNKNYLIIKKYDGDIKNCIYDCMMQIIYKIVSVLILYIKKYKQHLATLPHNK